MWSSLLPTKTRAWQDVRARDVHLPLYFVRGDMVVQTHTPYWHAVSLCALTVASLDREVALRLTLNTPVCLFSHSKKDQRYIGASGTVAHGRFRNALGKQFLSRRSRFPAPRDFTLAAYRRNLDAIQSLLRDVVSFIRAGSLGAAILRVQYHG